MNIVIPCNNNPAWRVPYKVTRAYYEHLGYKVIKASCPGPWSKGAAIASVFDKASDPLIVCDADLLIQPELLKEAVNMDGLVVPFNRVLNLSRDGQTVEKVRERFAWAGGCWVIAKDSYLSCGGVDPRFKEWGGEDEAFCLAVQALVGPVTLLEGDAWHLWHPPNPAKKTWKRTANWPLYMRYRGARRKPERMLEVIGR